MLILALLAPLAAPPSGPHPAVAGSPAPVAALSTRDLAHVNWMELREHVPSRITTVLLPLGTLEAHGVIANGADIVAPVAIAHAIAPRLNAMVAPAVPYGFTGGMDAYPGAFTVPEDVYRAYVRSVMLGLARNRFRNIVLVNGHGGGQTAILTALVAEVGREAGVRAMVVNWWSYCADVTKEVFGEEGGHAGDNETAFVMAVDPKLVHPDRYTPDMPLANPAPGTWAAYPNPTTIGLYKAGEGQPRFDPAKAKVYYGKVVDKVGALVEDTIRRWDKAGF